MTFLRALLLSLTPTGLLACGAPVCLVDPDSLALTRVITFDDIRSGSGPGRLADDVIDLDGAQFGERFAGQGLAAADTHDQVIGAALGPLILLPGQAGQNLSIVHFSGNAVLNGYGPAGFPRREGQGEGAIAWLFDNDQTALSFELRGGEDGAALAQFLRRDGSVIGAVPVEPLGEMTLGFARAGDIRDIAGVVLTNTDPQGIAIDTLRFGNPPDLS
ncbi:hypothetical protein FIU94_16865 [Sulfitobacter sp. THAF37]|uniref:hypothetical protein n=1 Tax=Sulfitobacter sp. THAF37 TaxID=2587855 RepID=UPI001268FECF|nr:hypothetical protein [Sulfitobacter sp. THAF37]QFT60503.1 hypothetical protein FIU94_16865 [Sulfitobacter sp. THAF37]